jgi:hypothetical protein
MQQDRLLEKAVYFRAKHGPYRYSFHSAHVVDQVLRRFFYPAGIPE